MSSPAGAFLRWAGRLRFPTLLALTACLFLIDLMVPDFVPLVDEILLGLLTILLSSWRKPRDKPEAPPRP